MYESKKSILARKLAEKLISHHNDLVFNRELGGKADKLLGLFFRTYRWEMVEALSDYHFDINKLKVAFVRDGIFAGTRDKPNLDKTAESILNLEDNLMFSDVLTDAKVIIDKINALKDEQQVGCAA